tara:strand:- start:910 stop:1017 length:108 start_codon:yes stop_codon:yes gene_type:complete
MKKEVPNWLILWLYGLSLGIIVMIIAFINLLIKLK